MTKSNGTMLPDVYRDIVAGVYIGTDVDIIATNPKNFSDKYRKILTEILKTRNLIFDIRNPKDNTIIYTNYVLKTISMEEKMGSSYGFSYNLVFIENISEEIVQSDIDSSETIVAEGEQSQEKSVVVQDGEVDPIDIKG